MTDPINIKDFQHTIINQARLWGYDTTHNVLDFKKNPLQLNPFTSLTFAWQVAQARKQFINWITLPLVIQGEFWKTWADVYSPKGKE